MMFRAIVIAIQSCQPPSSSNHKLKTESMNIGSPTAHSASHLKISTDTAPPLVSHAPSILIANPAMHPPPSRIHPENVLEPKVLPESLVHDLHGHDHEFPALAADGGPGASAVSNGVVVGQVDIKHQLALGGLQLAGGQRFGIFGIVIEHRSDIDFQRALLADCRAQLVQRRERLVAFVDLVTVQIDGGGEFPAAQNGAAARGCGCGDFGSGSRAIVREPRVEQLVRKQAGVVD